MREENPYFSAVVVIWMALGNTNAVRSFVMAVTLTNGMVSCRERGGRGEKGGEGGERRGGEGGREGRGGRVEGRGGRGQCKEDADKKENIHTTSIKVAKTKIAPPPPKNSVLLMKTLLA